MWGMGLWDHGSMVPWDRGSILGYVAMGVWESGSTMGLWLGLWEHVGAVGLWIIRSCARFGFCPVIEDLKACSDDQDVDAIQDDQILTMLVFIGIYFCKPKCLNMYASGPKSTYKQIFLIKLQYRILKYFQSDFFNPTMRYFISNFRKYELVLV